MCSKNAVGWNYNLLTDTVSSVITVETLLFQKVVMILKRADVA